MFENAFRDILREHGIDQDTITRERPNSESVNYRIRSMLEQQAAENGEYSRDHEEYRATGRSAGLDKLQRETGIKDFYDALNGKRQFTPAERKRICELFNVAEDAIWY